MGSLLEREVCAKIETWVLAVAPGRIRLAATTWGWVHSH